MAVCPWIDSSYTMLSLQIATECSSARTKTTHLKYLQTTFIYTLDESTSLPISRHFPGMSEGRPSLDNLVQPRPFLYCTTPQRKGSGSFPRWWSFISMSLVCEMAVYRLGKPHSNKGFKVTAVGLQVNHNGDTAPNRVRYTNWRPFLVYFSYRSYIHPSDTDTKVLAACAVCGAFAARWTKRCKLTIGRATRSGVTVSLRAVTLAQNTAPGVALRLEGTSAYNTSENKDWRQDSIRLARNHVLCRKECAWITVHWRNNGQTHQNQHEPNHRSLKAGHYANLRLLKIVTLSHHYHKLDRDTIRTCIILYNILL